MELKKIFSPLNLIIASSAALAFMAGRHLAKKNALKKYIKGQIMDSATIEGNEKDLPKQIAFDLTAVPPAKITGGFYTAKLAKEQAKKIYDAWGVLNDDEDAIYLVYSLCKNQFQMQQIAIQYQGMYGVRLIDHIDSKFYDYEKKKLNDIIKSKPIK